MASGTKTAGVMGWPVAHSLSPKLHNYWLKHYKIEGAYAPFAVKPEELADAIKALPGKGMRGVNLTIPHKETALPLLDQLDAAAKTIGAVNTIVVGEDGTLHGSNTDAYGFIENIRPHLPTQKNKAVILGAGGAARAVCYALMQEGFAKSVIVNRTQKRAQTLAEQWPGKIIAHPWENRADLLEGADLLVNTTSLGLQGQEPLIIDLAVLPKAALVTDIVYKPLMTPLLEQAQARGNPVVDGLGMLIHQAVPGFEAWFGIRPEVTEELRQYVLHE